MTKTLGMAAVSAAQFNGNPDKNGKLPVILRPFAGKCPNKFVISGTVAETEGIQVGKSYLVNILEREESAEYGRQFQYQKLNELTALESASIVGSLGNAIILNVLEEETIPAVETVGAIPAEQ